MYLAAPGVVAQFSLREADAALKAGDYSTALAACERQFRLGNLDAGFRLAEMLTRGLGLPAQPEKAFALLSDLADRGETRAPAQSRPEL